MAFVQRTIAFGRSIGVAIASVATLALAACGNGDTARVSSNAETVEMAMQTWIGYGYAVIAADQGFFGDVDVRVQMIEDGTALVGGITGGTTTLLGTTLDQFMLLRSNDLPAQLLAVTDDSYGGDALAVPEEIARIEDLVGKRVAYTPGPSSEYVLATALASVGLTMDDIVPVTFADPGDTARAFASGQVDAAMLFEPFLSRTLERPNSRYLFTTRDFPEISVGCFAIREGVENGDQIATSFLEGIARAEAFAASNPEEADAILKRVWSVADEDLSIMRAGARLKGADESRRLTRSSSDGEPEVLQWLEAIDSYYQSRGVAGDNRAGIDDIHPIALGTASAP